MSNGSINFSDFKSFCMSILTSEGKEIRKYQNGSTWFFESPALPQAAIFVSFVSDGNLDEIRMIGFGIGCTDILEDMGHQHLLDEEGDLCDKIGYDEDVISVVKDVVMMEEMK